MDKKNILLGLLEKKNLSVDEKKLLKSLLNEDELKSFYDTYYTAARAFEQINHINTDDLRDYVLIKNNLAPEDNNIYSKQTDIENHLRNCGECTEEFAYLNMEFNDIEAHITKELKEKNDSVFTPFLSGKFQWTRYFVSLLVIAGFVYLTAYMLSEFTTPSAYKFASEFSEEYYITRGRSTDEFLQSASALESGNYREAIGYLEKDIVLNSSDATIFYSHYILGITYLNASAKDVAGLFPSYDAAMVNKGINHLKISLQKNTSGRFENITGDIYYHLGRGYLMQNNIDAARSNFSLVVKMKGSRMYEAEKILRETGK